MVRISLSGAAAGAVAAGGLVTAIAVLPGSAAATNGSVHAPRTATRAMHFAVRFTGFHDQVQKAHTTTPGDTVEFADKLTQDGTKVGTDIASCIYVTKVRFECTWTIRLSGGRIQIVGLGRDTNSPYNYPIVGGTGKYAGATGTLTVADVLKSVAHYTVTLN